MNGCADTTGAPRRGVVCLSTNHWTGLPTSKQHLMSVLSETRRVLYVDPPIDVFSALGRRRRWPALLGLRPAGRNLHVLSPVGLVAGGDPVRRARFYERFSSRVRRAADSLGLADPILWAFGPEHVACAGRLGESLLVYQASDEPAAFGRRPEATRALEAEMLERADIVLAVSEQLVKARSHTGKAHRLPNAADRRHYSRVLAGAPDVSLEEFICALGGQRQAPPGVAGLSRPVVLYGGAAYEWFDAELFASVAERRPGWTFLIVGPTGASVTGRGLPANVVALGRRSYDEFPLYVAAADAAVIPWREGVFSANADPIVLYEYLLCGKPVVATAFPAALERGEFVRTAASPEEFAAQLDAALRDDTGPSSVRARVEFGFDNTWEDRAEKAARLIDGALKGRSLNVSAR